MLLEVVTPGYGGSLLQLSTTQECLVENQLQAANKERRAIHLVENTPLTLSHKSPRTGDTSHTHSTKRRKAKGDEGTVTSHPKSNMENSQRRTCHNIAIPTIEIVAQLWYGYPVHEATANQRGLPILKEIRLD